jgi:hypothetical protein
VTSFNRSNFVYAVSVVTGALASLLVFCFLVFAFLSPDIEVNLPGGSGCRGTECIPGGGRGGD